MFAIFKKGFKFRFPDGNFWKVGKDYMGDVPAAVANHPLFKAAVAGGDIMTPDTHRDKDIHTAEDRAALAAAKADIRPDAAKPEEVPAENEKPLKKASRRVKTQK